MNAACPIPAVPSPAHQTIGELLSGLDVQDKADPEETPSTQGVPVKATAIVTSPARTEDTLSLPCSPTMDEMTEDLPVPSPAETVFYNENAEPTVSAETVY